MWISNGKRTRGPRAMSTPVDRAAIEARLRELRALHRALDEEIRAQAGDPALDQLALQRLKKRKLELKDTIARLESERLPDIIA
jgi:hypothetical protein